MNITTLKKGIYYVGAVDWNVRSFHGYTTNRGATYNAYLVVDEKVALIDTVKAPFAKELLQRIGEIIDPEKIDYIISNHVEMDHSGALPEVLKVAKNAKIVTSSPHGLKGLMAHYGTDFEYESVKAGDNLSLGERSLTFVATPMLHWPDNMITYCPEEKILFSNDAFGQHFASNKHFDYEVDMDVVMQEAKKYYANILMPYGAQAAKALEIVKGLDIDIIAPSHGIIWEKHIDTILKAYEMYSLGELDKEAAIVYDSMWHSTELIAHSILEGCSKAGVSAKLYDLKENHISDIVTDILKMEYIIIGSPTLNTQMLPTVASFLTYLKGLSPKGRKGFAFGSHGWGGQGVMNVNKAMEEMHIEIIMDTIKQVYIPTNEELKEYENRVCELMKC